MHQILFFITFIHHITQIFKIGSVKKNYYVDHNSDPCDQTRNLRGATTAVLRGEQVTTARVNKKKLSSRRTLHYKMFCSI